MVGEPLALNIFLVSASGAAARVDRILYIKALWMGRSLWARYLWYAAFSGQAMANKMPVMELCECPKRPEQELSSLKGQIRHKRQPSTNPSWSCIQYYGPCWPLRWEWKSLWW
ncbi:hypothetical protein EJ06DRAFT_266161 [Trichodelitschia bisporula]|uniref:Uncharacterized protein n=1 Tax=Trichodelitschia bisporula TaxID=703511 RepID=A0A6G1HIG0_9PEZI|nr:hypothetical protein EJ06DRAFT_266161 [Trichodelitschia bisporula]